MCRRNQFAEFEEQVTQLIVPENPDKIREIKNFDEFSSLFESLLERVESTINPFVTSAGYSRHPFDDLCVRAPDISGIHAMTCVYDINF